LPDLTDRRLVLKLNLKMTAGQALAECPAVAWSFATRASSPGAPAAITGVPIQIPSTCQTARVSSTETET
jgi:hypothetical protein